VPKNDHKPYFNVKKMNKKFKTEIPEKRRVKIIHSRLTKKTNRNLKNTTTYKRYLKDSAKIHAQGKKRNLKNIYKSMYQTNQKLQRLLRKARSN